MADNWSDEELKAAVEAYTAMVRQSQLGQTVHKKSVYEELAQRFGRTTKAFEYRMQNISYVYSTMGREWVQGLRPAKNVGTRVAAAIEAMIAEVEASPAQRVVSRPSSSISAPTSALPTHALALAAPRGNRNPTTVSSPTPQFVRDPQVKDWVLWAASGVCENCASRAPFSSSGGVPFLEVHHVRTLAAGGSDTIENAVALCPNCHREFHYGANSAALVSAIYVKCARLIKE